MRLLLVLMTFVVAVTGYKRICYYTNWSQYRPSGQTFWPENVDTSLCSHVIFAFSTMSGNKIKTFEWNDEPMFKRFQALKQKNSQLKTLLAVGGWNFGTTRMTSMLETHINRREFVNTSISFLRRNGFDGLDLDFEYPGKRGSPAEDRERFTHLVTELRAAFDSEATNTGRPVLLLTAAVAAGIGNIDAAYNIPVITRHLDWVGLMAYDLHGGWESFTGLHTALYSRADETGVQSTLNLEYAANYWISKGCPKNKLIIGMAAYGRTFELVNPSNNGLAATAKGAGKPGKFTREKGFLSYYEICEGFSHGKGVQVWNDEQKVPYAYKGTQWVGYENLRSITIKANWLVAGGYEGFMMWSLDLDDFTGTSCGQGKYPILKRLNDILNGDVFTTKAPVTNHNGDVVTTTMASTTTAEPQTVDPTKNNYGGGGADFSCATKHNGFYVYTPKCGAFWSCQQGKRYYFDCPAGLVFNPNMSYCDWPINVPVDIMCINA